ncbi:MAG TPA: hypothetical protein RMG48_20595 [Myxococcales bacterium LLY-WYZ-16_1]|nr:hypothetical protein [Myxococcales bacterium LLY-WYZ-16_1]
MVQSVGLDGLQRSLGLSSAAPVSLSDLGNYTSTEQALSFAMDAIGVDLAESVSISPAAAAVAETIAAGLPGTEMSASQKLGLGLSVVSMNPVGIAVGLNNLAGDPLGLGDTIDSVTDAVGEVLGDVGRAVMGAVGLDEETIESTISGVAGFAETVASLPDQAMNAIGSFADEVGLTDLADDVTDTLGGLADAAIGGLQDVAEAVGLGDVAEAVSDVAAAVGIGDDSAAAAAADAAEAEAEAEASESEASDGESAGAAGEAGGAADGAGGDSDGGDSDGGGSDGGGSDGGDSGGGDGGGDGGGKG